MCRLLAVVALALMGAARPTAATYDPAIAARHFSKLSKFTSTGTGTCTGSSSTGWFFGASDDTITCATPIIHATEEVKISADFSGSVEIGFCDGRQGTPDAKERTCWMIDLSDCCETSKDHNGRRSCLPRFDCPRSEFQLHWDPDAASLAIEAKDGHGAYPLFTDRHTRTGRFPSSKDLYFTVKATGSKGRVTGLKVISKQAAWVEEMSAKGGIVAGPGTGRCGKTSAACGDSCFGVCPENPVTSDSFCMCFPKGYTGVSGQFHSGAACLKQCGTGQRAEAARNGEHAHAAFADGEQQGSGDELSGMSLTDLLLMKAFLDDNDDGFDDETLELLMAKLKGDL